MTFLPLLQAAARHIPKCKDIIAKPSFLRAGGGNGGGNIQGRSSANGLAGGGFRR